MQLLGGHPMSENLCDAWDGIRRPPRALGSERQFVMDSFGGGHRWNRVRATR